MCRGYGPSFLSKRAQCKCVSDLRGKWTSQLFSAQRSRFQSWAAHQIYMYDPSTWTRNNECMQSLFCDHSAMLAMQPLLRNLCGAIFAMQSVLCYMLLEELKTTGFPFFVCIQSAQKQHKTSVVCKILLDMFSKALVFLVFCIQNVQTLCETCVFNIVSLNMLKNKSFSCFICMESAQKLFKTYVFCNMLLNM